jgi:hypothetical protein
MTTLAECVQDAITTHGRTAMSTPPADETTASGMSITQLAEHLGISAAVLRVWELRYGWPKPERQPNGFRFYPRPLIFILERVRDEIRLGKTIGELLCDTWWQQVFTTGAFPKPLTRAPTEPSWSSLPLPASPRGRDIRERLQHALVANDERMIGWAVAMAEQLRPEEREYAVKAVLRMWHRHQSVET